MAKDDTSAGGLFSKVVRFVKNPGTQWNELDEESSNRDGSLSKQALKEMIERKRMNDFVRKREFDMLRKLRRREATGEKPGDGSARPSFFQSSMPSRPDDRAMTLKKIDEIEAQMSMQWWKTKHGNAASSTMPPGSEFPNSNIAANSQPTNLTANSAARAAAASNNLAYARTAPDDLQNALAASAAKHAIPEPQAATPGSAAASAPSASASASASAVDPFALAAAAARSAPQAPLGAAATAAVASKTPAPVQQPPQPLAAAPAPVQTAAKAAQGPAPAPAPAKAPASPPKAQIMGGLAASYDASGASTGFSASKLFALEVDEVQHDPELEEAAIRFANADDDGAEAGLKDAISPVGQRYQHEETWLALFDLYRATGQYEKFESLAIDFAGKFNRSAPMWFSIPEMVGRMGGGSQDAPAEGARKSDWRCPAVFGIQSLAAMNGAISKASPPWTLDWSALNTIDDNAAAALVKQFLSWAAQPVQLRFAGGAKLEDVLRRSAPSGDKSVDQDRWKLLLAFYRISHRPDEFELAALDFCVTYEVSPPSWESARCECKMLDAEGQTAAGQTFIGDAVRDSVASQMSEVGGASMSTAQLATVELSGQIMGEPGPVLEKLEARLMGADVMIISCAKLIRVDFSAAGSLLNWVSARQSEGRLVQFTDVHRLVAAFFHVIGISEHAKVAIRAD
jgi:anti-anti-sigma regulatory factor